MSTIAAIMDAVTELQASLTVSEPDNYSVTKVYRYFLDPQYELSGPRVFMNEWTFKPVDFSRMMALRELEYAIRMQFMAAEAIADAARTTLVAEAFWEATMNLFCQNVGLKGTATRALLRGAEPTIGLIVRGGKAYIGFEAYLDVQIRSQYLWRN